MSSNIFARTIDREIIPGSSGSFESQSSIEESNLQQCMSKRKDVPK